ncbi:MAG: ferric reductase-like transmembrane domain-containing protein, partial [Chitinophagaceae bacterium]|nr:ferric reductase-like transmembrane domain-containing protein [Chitinophagaceae bacterium]
LLGMMLSTAYKRSVYWQKMPALIRKLSIDDLHNWTAYVALLFVVLHPAFLLLDKTAGFKLVDVFAPNHAPNQPTVVWLGTFSMYAVLLVIITTQKVVKRKMGFRLWKNIHLISYLTAVLFVVHGLLMDPLLKDRPTDWFDAEKFLSEICFLLLLLATIARCRYHLKNKTRLQADE